MNEPKVKLYILARQLGVANEVLIEKLRTRGLAVDNANDSISEREASVIVREARQKGIQATAPVKPTSSVRLPTPRVPLRSPQAPILPRPTLSTAPKPPLSTFFQKPPLKPALPLTAPKLPVPPVSNSRGVPLKNTPPLMAPKPPPLLFKPKPGAPKSNFFTPLEAETFASSPNLSVNASNTPIASDVVSTTVRSSSFAPTPPPLPVISKQKPLTAPIVPPSAFLRPKPEGEPSEPVKLKTLSVKPPLVLRELAMLLDVKPFRLISELMKDGVFASINQVMDETVAQKLAARHGVELIFKRRTQENLSQKPKEAPKIDESKLLEPRPPIVCILGHVDHGKTTLLDTIRKTRVAAREAGGITQHVGAYQVEANGKKITFLDTPGHAAFSKIRQRGATVTDIAVLVVAADDGFMPQTEEALRFAQKENVPVVVAINKIDAKGADLDRVKQQMQKYGIMSEDWGGQTLCVGISALKGTNVDQLLELILLQAEMMDLKANPQGAAEGVIIESRIEAGRGATATVIVNKGTLRSGDALVCGSCVCKARALLDENNKPVKEARPSTPVQILGWSDAPEAGATFHVAKNEKEARREAEDAARSKQASEGGDSRKIQNIEELMAALDAKEHPALRVVIRGDVHGSVEALTDCLQAINSQKVDLTVIDAGVGQITLNDIHLAHASKAVIVGFNTKLENGAQAAAKHDGVRILQHNIIYELIDQVKNAMRELLDPEWLENKLGSAEVRKLFTVSKRLIAGCMVVSGKMVHGALARQIRKGQVLTETKIVTLKRFKDDVNEVKSGYECGIELSNLSEALLEGDVIECYEKVSKLPDL